jgi:hypothetical protein
VLLHCTLLPPSIPVPGASDPRNQDILEDELPTECKRGLCSSRLSNNRSSKMSYRSSGWEISTPRSRSTPDPTRSCSKDHVYRMDTSWAGRIIALALAPRGTSRISERARRSYRSSGWEISTPRSRSTPDPTRSCSRRQRFQYSVGSSSSRIHFRGAVVGEPRAAKTTFTEWTLRGQGGS